MHEYMYIYIYMSVPWSIISTTLSILHLLEDFELHNATFIISTETGAGGAAAGGGDAAAKEVLLKNVGWEIQGISSDSWLNWKLGIIFLGY